MRTVCFGGIAGLIFAAGSALGQFSTQTPPPVTVPASTAPTTPQTPLPEVAAAKAKDLRDKAIAFLREKQDKNLGAWGVKDGVAPFPAITGLVVLGMILEPGMTDADPTVGAGMKYLLSSQKPDGGFYVTLLPTYNTAICLSAVSRSKLPAAKDAVVNAQKFLKRLQFSEDATTIPGLDESPKPVEKSDSFYGGWGYGRHGRPDMSNTQWALEALYDSGVPSDDPAFQRALVFLQRCQMVDSINEMSYADGSTQGGFIYATSENKDKVGIGQSFAGTIEETLSDGTKASRLRAYGSMTYAGFKSYLYAGLTKDDPRVVQAKRWIAENYTLAENPGMGTDGYYYYLVTFSRALEAGGEAKITPVLKETPKDGTPPGTPRDWRVDLIDRLAELQQPDGSFKSVDDRWMENDPVLITAYSLIALQHASK
jgi:squalene-hopene/tetraprenyl-beta-curcumene cyclase